jgi:phosphohistidine phosphatase
VKSLTLMRHANAKWQDRDVADFERPLNRRGNGEAEAMARRLIELEVKPDLILTSSATRTRQTAEIVARELGIPAQHVRADESLYLARAKDILKVINATGPRVPHLMVVGHNPGISRLVHELGGCLNEEDMNTGSVCSMKFDARVWSEVSANCLRDCVYESPPTRLFSALWA